MAMRRARGQVRIELGFAAAAMTVAFVGFYTVVVKGEEAESADAGRAALGLPADDELTDTGSLIIGGDGDGFVVSDDEGGAEPGAAGVDGYDGSDVAGAPGTTGPDGLPVGTSGGGVLPSEGAAGDGTFPGTVPGGEAGGGSETSVPPTSTTGPDTSTSTSTSEPDQPSTSPTTEAPANTGIIGAILDLLGLG
jgi:hypothetical protein